ncbi:hypothetical protein GCM10027290_41290 [Micromonospora sonneratiae]|uniref:MYXO-CTERM domain-containing protein n=1 Tax=Micromonospora sonneratiae TaxID=1184706 RepID=A0ABW3YKE8_9ACTN
MFGIGRRRTHSQLAKAELGESIDHFRRAATHAAGGVGATVGPRMTAAREYVAPTAARFRDRASYGWGATVTALAPLAVAAADGARQAGATARKAKPRKMRAMRKKESLMARRRWPMVTGILAAGAMIGVAGAVAMRRRRQQEWESYEAGHALDTAREDAEVLAAGSTGTTTDPTSATPAADRSMDRTMEKVADRVADRTAAATMGDSARKGSAKSAANRTDGVLGSATTSAGNSQN